MSNSSKQGTKDCSDKSLIDLDRIDQCLDDVARERQGNRPEGFTVKEYAKQAGIGESGAFKRLNSLVEAGKLDVVKWHVNNSPTNVYQFKEQANGEPTN